ncbi:MAG TPA: 6,7-dimethyl-8-ribityllumazine synthase [Candidatus Dormibacteraeota bacterium]|nr:6,7-dimethyl-8-ribityllumazine synthase [Candidatus Dormibacteraeota bacterium]
MDTEQQHDDAMGKERGSAELPGSDLAIAMVVARANESVSRRLLRGALNTLSELGVSEPDVLWVPGPLDLPVVALALAEKGGYDALVCLACVIHDDASGDIDTVIVAQTTAGLMQVQLDTGVPISIGVLAADDREQAQARSGPKSNRGAEAAQAAIETANLLREIQG